MLCSRAGYKVTVIDTSDQDWWKGKCLGRIGYFPSKYVIKLQPGERPLQVTHNLQVSDGDNGLMLLRDQVSQSHFFNCMNEWFTGRNFWSWHELAAKQAAKHSC
jgi:hypothetical protein